MGAHNERLQSLRGLAALCVLGGHSALILSTHAALTLQQFFQPNAAVILFYVLSGYVLSLSLDRDPNVPRFLVRRLFRIMPVYWLGVFVSCASYLIADHAPIDGATQWFNGTISGSAGAVEWGNIWPNLTGWTTSMSGVLWSVQVELFTAPFIPLMLYVSRRVPLLVDVLIVAALVVVMRYLRPSTLLQETPQLTFVAYLLCFYLGVVLPKLLAIAQPNRWIFGRGQLALAVVAFSVCLCGHASAFHISFWGYLVACAFFSAWLVAYGGTAQKGGPLSWCPLTWLGDVSYSFYAYGTPILYPVALAVFSLVPTTWRTTDIGSAAIILLAFAGSLIITLPLATLSYRFIERPGIRLGSLLLRLRAKFAERSKLRPVEQIPELAFGAEAD
jgi:peptidoglycan/LPS O-acetylase OafA/YrhL